MAPKRVNPLSRDWFVRALDESLYESLRIFGDLRGRHRRRPLLHVRRKCIERGQGSPLEDVIQVEIVSVLKDGFESRIERSDPVHLH